VLPAEAIGEALSRIAPIALEGYAFRYVPERHRGTALGGDGSHRNGGRYNPPGIGALYTSLQRHTALAERTYFLSDEDPLEPQLLLTFDYSVTAIIDLMDGGVLLALDTTETEITAAVPNPSLGTAPTQILGAATKACGLQGILAPSRAYAGGKNLVLFTENLDPGAYVVYDLPDHRFSSYALVPVRADAPRNVIEFPRGEYRG